jgi:hypothetical protein
MAEIKAPNVSKLYHGTTGRAAVEIIGGGAIIPPASSPKLAKRYLVPNNQYPIDQRCVYLIPRAFEAIMFGTVRAVGMKWRQGEYELNAFSKRHDSVVIFAVDPKSLNPLLRESSLYPKEVAYEGVVELGETMEGVEFPMTPELYEFGRDV